ncbi:MAG: hypothetical protein GF353_26115 [Candidatus Lokiarchaeota archaeon]|nr:hypothetical protein [Candidatus Lokiarchaeota archaeon]
MVLTGDQEADIPLFARTDQSDRIFVITRTQFFELIGIDIKVKTHQKYIKLFDAFHSLYSKALESKVWFKILAKESLKLLNEMKRIKNYNDIPVTSSGYKNFCENHPDRQIKNLYRDESDNQGSILKKLLKK